MNVTQIAPAVNSANIETEQSDRLFYLSAATIDMCASVLNRLLVDARNGKLGENARKNISAQTSTRHFSCAVKELSVAFAYLMIFDNGAAEMGDEKFEFVKGMFPAIDKIVVGTSVKEITLLNSQMLGYEICDSIAESVVKMVGAANCQELRAIISEFIRQGYSIRKNLLSDSLNLPICVIQKSINSALSRPAKAA